MIFYLIYISRAVKLLTESELEFLLQQSRRNNLTYHITGMLLYVRGNFTGSQEEEGRFVQVLEGTEENVRLIYKKIEEDDRHHNLIVLEENFVEVRNFDRWTMGFQVSNLEQLKNNPALFNLDYNFLDYKKEEESNKPLEMLKGFYTIHLDGDQTENSAGD